mgnify:CR=1 FL=1
MPLSSTFKKQFKHLCALGEKINTYAGQIMAMPVAGDGGDIVPVLNLIGKLQVNWLTAATATPELAKIYRQSIKVMPNGKLPTIDLNPESIDEEQAGYLFGVVFYALMLWEATKRIAASSLEFEIFSLSLESKTVGHIAEQELMQFQSLMTGQTESHHQQEIQKSVDALLKKELIPAKEEATESSLLEALDELEIGALLYEKSLSSNPRYITIAADFDGNAHLRAGLTEELKVLVAATVVSNDPDRFQTLWKATIGSAASSLKWRPPHRNGNQIPDAPSDSPIVRRAIRVLRMVHELHKAGFQRLRVLPYSNDSGTAWRAEITYVDNVGDDGFSTIDLDMEEAGKVARYSTTQGNQYFGWADASTADARGLARLFQMRFPHLCNLGQGLDWAYAGWLVDVIGWAEQSAEESGLICLLSPGEVNPEHLRRWQPPPPIRL